MPFVEYNGKKMLYIHVPKTGGGSIEEWMKTLSPLRFHSIGVPTCLRVTPQHLRMSDFLNLFGDNYFDYKFMTIRNPYDRIVSEYKMHAKIGGSGFWQAWPSFSQWLESSLDAARVNRDTFDNHLRPQWEFLGTGVEPLRFEDTIPAIIRHMALKIDAPDPLIPPKKHSSELLDIAANFDHIDRLRVQDFYSKDFEIFRYDINDFGSTVNS